MNILTENYKANYNKIYEDFDQALTDLKIAFTSNASFKYNEMVDAITKDGSKISGIIKVIEVDRNGEFQYYVFIDNAPIMYSNTKIWFSAENLKKINFQ